MRDEKENETKFLEFGIVKVSSEKGRCKVFSNTALLCSTILDNLIL